MCFVSLLHTSCFIVVNIDTFKLKIRITMICTRWIDTMFIRNHFPKLETCSQIRENFSQHQSIYFGANLVPTLTSLKVNNFTHDLFFVIIVLKTKRKKVTIIDL